MRDDNHYSEKQKKRITKLSEKFHKIIDKGDLESSLTALNVSIMSVIAHVASTPKEADEIIDALAFRTKDTLKTMHAMGVLNWKDPPARN